MKYPDKKAIKAAKKVILNYKNILEIILDANYENSNGVPMMFLQEKFYKMCAFCKLYWEPHRFGESENMCLGCPILKGDGLSCYDENSWYETHIKEPEHYSTFFILARLCWLHDLVAGRLIFPEVEDD